MVKKSLTFIGQGTMKVTFDPSFFVFTECHDTECIIGENGGGFIDIIFLIIGSQKGLLICLLKTI